MTITRPGDDPPVREPYPLRGRSVLITGVSRRAGIGYATACRLADLGASLYCQHFAPHDAEQPWGADDPTAVMAGIREHLVGDATLHAISADLGAPDAADQLIATAVAALGHLDVLICNQALSGSDGPLGELTAPELDRHWAVDTRASILLTQAFANQHDAARSGAVVFLTSGQGLGPLPGEIAYATAKAALAGVTLTIADQLADQNIRVNTVNPGPVDTGYLDAAEWHALLPMFPFGRVGQPADAARLIVWLVTDEAAWLTGQVINSEGGFARWRAPGSD